MARTPSGNETFFSNYPTAPDGVVRTDAPDKKHPLVAGAAAGAAVTGTIAVGAAAANTAGVGTRSDRKIV